MPTKIIIADHIDAVLSASFSPDGKRIVSASADNTLRIWDVATGKPIGSPMYGHTDYVRFASFSPNGKHIVSASDDKTLRLWDATTGKSLGVPLTGHSGWVLSAVFSPNGKRIVSASKDKTIRIWDLPSVDDNRPLPELIADIRKRLNGRQLTQEERRRYYLD